MSSTCLSKDEQETIKTVLLNFINEVTERAFASTEQVSTLCIVVELLAKYF